MLQAILVKVGTAVLMKFSGIIFDLILDFIEDKKDASDIRKAAEIEDASQRAKDLNAVFTR